MQIGLGMTGSTHYDFCIIGAGPTGLTLAYQLLKGGGRVLLIERDDRTGGLAQSHNYSGHIFDVGPKRFHTEDPVVLAFIEEIAREDLLRISRSTEVHFLRRYFGWPLTTRDLWRLPPGLALRSAFELLHKRAVTDPTSYRQYIVSKYGESLFRTFFEPYTRKFLRWDVEDIHSDWASTGIDRTVVGDQAKSSSGFALVKSLLLPAKLDTEFLYPTAGGFGGFYHKLLALCQRHEGFHLRLKDAVRTLAGTGNGLEGTTVEGCGFSCGQLAWSGNLNDLSRILGTGTALPYLNTIFYNCITRADGARHKGAQWIYVSQGDTLVSRITCMREFAPYTCPPGYYNFICEVTDSQREPCYFPLAETLTGKILGELKDMKFLRNHSHVEAVEINRVVDTYPIYHQGYLKQFADAAAAARKFSKRIHLVGRSGAFWYNNSDHAIRFSLETARKLLGETKGDFDYRDYFGGRQARAADPRGVK
jgi:protoporphyrinogen oxidase